MRKTLHQLPIGEDAYIREILTDTVTKERLESLGIIEGSQVNAVRSAPLGCPRIYKTLNTLIALRNDVAKQIVIEEIQPKESLLKGSEHHE